VQVVVCGKETFIENVNSSYDYQLLQTKIDQKVTIKDEEIKKLFTFSPGMSSSELCDNKTMGLYHD
jgi:hypothetical protein